MNAQTPRTHYTRAITEQDLNAPVDKTWPEYLQEGRDWARRTFHPKSSHIIGLENSAFAYADMNAPVAVKRAWFAAAKVARDAGVCGVSGVQKLADLREPPVVGRFYLVPAIVGYPYFGKVDTWPVIGPKHADGEFIKLFDEHYHIDARFLTAAQERFAMGSYSLSIEEVVGRTPLATRGSPLPKGRPTLVRRKCRRDTYGHVYGHHDEIKAMRAHYGEPDAIRLADGRTLCPHRKADLTQFPRDADGMVTCPLHGLRVRCAA